MVKSCVNCEYASWHKTESGLDHPAGYGRCDYKYILPALPHSMKWFGRNPPYHSSGVINKKIDVKITCAYYISIKR